MSHIILTPATTKEYTEFRYLFTDSHGNGFAFPCDEDGNIKIINEDARRNLNEARQHAGAYKTVGIHKYSRLYREPAHGRCSCGKNVVLENQYYGACQCPNCGQWYNLFGESILPPEQW